MTLKKHTFTCLLLFAFLTPFFTLSQEKTGDFEKEIARLNGKKKAEKYIEIISGQQTRSPQTGIKLGEQALQEFTQEAFLSERAKLLCLLGDSYLRYEV